MNYKIEEGISKTIRREVTSLNSAGMYGSGVLDFLLSTPAAISMAIEASIALLDPLLPDGYVTVGRSIDMQHRQPTLVGEGISLTVSVIEVKNDHILLDIEIHDTHGLVIKGRHERSVINASELIRAAYARSEQK